MTVAVSPQPKRRPRRIAADEAHAWARNLRLGNPYAKLVLSMLTLYVNGDGACFVGIEALADDTELSADTVRKRLALLETVGAIARFPQWIDGNGHRNGAGKGKRTSDEIRLLIHADPDEIEARAKGDGEGGSDAITTEISPRPQQGQQTENKTVSPPVALCQPSDSGKGLISEPEPEDSPPNPPPGGGQAVVDQDLEDDIGEFAKTYPSPITNLPRLRTVLMAMTKPERARVLTAVKGYASHIAECERKKKPRAVKDADRWVAAGMWQGYVLQGERAQVEAHRVKIAVDSLEGRAWRNICKIGRAVSPMESGGCYQLARSLTPQELAFADLPPERDWEFIISGEQVSMTGAWSEFMAKALHGVIHATMAQDRGIGADCKRGIFVPWPYPPRKDGALSTTGPPDPLSEQDKRDFAESK